MNIDAHIIAWNESETIHLTLQHYMSFCRHVYIYDNFSTDNTRDIAEEYGAIVKLFGIEGQLNDAEYLKVKNHCWKGSDADWVIVCDADEILFNQVDIKFELMDADKLGSTLVKPQGYSMYSNNMPQSEWINIETGIIDSNYSKIVCFKPNRINEINYIYGCHEARPEGDIRYYYGFFNLLHYKYVGGINRLLKRHRLYKERLSPINKRFNLGHVYSMDEKEQIDNFNMNLANAKPIF